jgi:acyl carrier protein
VSEHPTSEVGVEATLRTMVDAIWESLGRSVEISQIQYDVDIFDDAANVVVDRRLDSLDIIEIIAAIENALGPAFGREHARSTRERPVRWHVNRS